MRFAGIFCFAAVCCFVIGGMFIGGCSDDDEISNPVSPKPLAGVWAPVGTGAGLSVSGQAFALTVDNTELILGGSFSSVDSVAANGIAAWDGSSWAPLGGGITGGPVRALITFGPYLVAGGAFDHAGGTSVNNIAIFDGSSWAPLGPGRGTVVLALAFHSGVLLAGGDSGVDGGLAGFGGSWITLDPNMDVSAFTIIDDTLIIGGSFDDVGDSSGDNIVAIGGLGFTSLGIGIQGSVFSLAVYNGKLIAGGYFSSAGGVSVNNIAAWDGSAWARLGTGLNSGVYSLTVVGNLLIAGGQFTNAGGTGGKYIAGWDGTSWKTLGTGTDGMVWAVTTLGNQVIAGGDFTTAGGVNAHGIASWTPQ